MNNILKILALSLVCLHSVAYPLKTLIKDVVYHITHPIEFITGNDKEDYWFAYSVPAQANTKSSCCWNSSKKDGLKFASCNLKEEINGFGSSDENQNTAMNNIFVHIENKQVSQVFPVGEQCKVIADGIDISWLADIEELESIEFLRNLAIQEEGAIVDNSLYALALHESNKASLELYNIASSNQESSSSKAIFWLGEARNDGFAHLEKLYNHLPNGSNKLSINIALSQSNDNKAVALLEKITLHDKNPKQRTDAMFWLAEKAPLRAKEIVLNQLSKESILKNEDLIFTLSRLPNGLGDESLFEILKGEYSIAIKKKSLFWLSHSEDKETIDKLQMMF